MSWTTPAFEEIKMDAEAKSYFDGLTGPGVATAVPQRRGGPHAAGGLAAAAESTPAAEH